MHERVYKARAIFSVNSLMTCILLLDLFFVLVFFLLSILYVPLPFFRSIDGYDRVRSPRMPQITPKLRGVYFERLFRQISLKVCLPTYPIRYLLFFRRNFDLICQNFFGDIFQSMFADIFMFYWKSIKATSSTLSIPTIFYVCCVQVLEGSFPLLLM